MDPQLVQFIDTAMYIFCIFAGVHIMLLTAIFFALLGGKK